MAARGWRDLGAARTAGSERLIQASAPQSPGIRGELSRTMRMIVRVMRVAILSAFLAGCNTVHGIGQDIAKGGEAIQKAAK